MLSFSLDNCREFSEAAWGGQAINPRILRGVQTGGNWVTISPVTAGSLGSSRAVCRPRLPSSLLPSSLLPSFLGGETGMCGEAGMFGFRSNDDGDAQYDSLGEDNVE